MRRIINEKHTIDAVNGKKKNWKVTPIALAISKCIACSFPLQNSANSFKQHFSVTEKSSWKRSELDESRLQQPEEGKGLGRLVDNRHSPAANGQVSTRGKKGKPVAHFAFAMRPRECCRRRRATRTMRFTRVSWARFRRRGEVGEQVTDELVPGTNGPGNPWMNARTSSTHSQHSFPR